MNKFLNRVTLTGIDQYTPAISIRKLQQAYPFVEFAVLLSQSKTGLENRYPPISWVQDILHLRQDGHVLSRMSLAGHLCGSWVRDLIDDGDEFYKFAVANDLLNGFDRIQLNVSHLFAKMSNTKLDTMLKVLNKPEWAHVRFIVQVRSYDLPKSFRELANVDYLFDCSGGRGVLPDSWPPAIENCGYAGGLNPENLAQQLPIIGEAAGDIPVWIDAETGVRTNAVFDLDKAEHFLAITKEFVM